MNIEKRICGLDLIRVFAIFFVIAGHFLFVNTAYCETPIHSTSVFLQRMMMSVFYVSVPLFMMLTGYLNIHKKPIMTYYRGMMRVLVAYFFFSILTILFRVYYLSEDMTLMQWLLTILNFSAIRYAWYIELWIGLALLTPYLNYLWHAIPTMREKLLLIGTLFVMTALPETINPRVEVFPDYFQSACYPLMYYFIGTFIYEYQPMIRLHYGLLVIFLLSIANPIATLVLAGCESTDYGLTGGPGGVCSTCIAVTIFLMLYRRDISIKPIKRWVTHCSMVSLEMYLCCWMFDQLYYPWFKERFYESQSQFLPWFLVIVPLVFFSSYFVASIYNYIAAKIRSKVNSQQTTVNG